MNIPRFFVFLGAIQAAATAWSVPAYEPWPDAAVKTFSRIPVQEDGRVKPFLTVAHWKLIELSGKSNLVTLTPEEARANPSGMPPGREGVPRKLSASAWLLDVFFRPEQAKEYPVFLVDDSDAVTAIGVQTKEKKRSYYSYKELLPGRDKLAELTATYSEKESRKEELTALESQIMNLGRKVNTFELLASALGPAQPSQLLNSGMVAPELNGLLEHFQVSGLLERMPKMPFDSLMGQIPQDSAKVSEDERTMLSVLMRCVYVLGRNATALTPFPPQSPSEPDWISPGAVVVTALENDGADRAWALDRLRRLEKLAGAARSPSTFPAALEEFRGSIQSEASARGEGKGIAKEVELYDKSVLSNAKILFILGFVFMLLGWLNPPSKSGRIAATAGLWTGFVALGYLIRGMTLRSQISGWAPVTNLYETFLIISAGGFIFGVLVEFFNPRRNRIAISAGLFIPAVCLLLASQFVTEVKPSDTLPPLGAVLRSNFWLTTHVITITLGYAAGLLAALVTHCWLIGQAFGLGTRDRSAYRTITQMSYGIVLFSLLFSLVGTILGGIWANYSWGRFWGWDPKENGALMIVLWTLFIIHARLGDLVRELGLHVLILLLGCIIGFSWFGVNALGVGLHSYGFASGIWKALFIFWGIEGAVLLLAAWIKVREHPAFFPEAEIEKAES